MVSESDVGIPLGGVRDRHADGSADDHGNGSIRGRWFVVPTRAGRRHDEALPKPDASGEDHMPDRPGELHRARGGYRARDGGIQRLLNTSREVHRPDSRLRRFPLTQNTDTDS
jgi:hypothetical protein